MRFADTNVVLRYLIGGAGNADGAIAAACLALFLRVDQCVEEITTSEAVLVEVVYVSVSPRQYGLSHAEIASRLRPILAMRGFKLPRKGLYLKALDIFTSSPLLDFEDALTVAYLEHLGIEELLSYDRGFDRVPGIRRQEPSPADGLR